MIDLKKYFSVNKKKKQKKEETVLSGIYPTWKYHKHFEAVIVNSEDEEQELGPGWENSPAYFDSKARV